MTFIGIDIGTFETKGVLVDADGEVLALARRRHGISTPRPGHVEHHPETDWWADLAAVASELMKHPRARDLQAAAVSAIGPCVVAVDDDLSPVRPAILYGVDTRATAQIEDLTDRLGAAEIFRRCGNPLTSQSAGPKIAWIRDQEPQAWARARWFMTSQTWLVAKLTGAVVMDHATAGYFHPLYDLREAQWNLAGCEDVVTSDRLPRLEWTTTIAGTVHERASAETGLPVGTPVIVGTTDAPAEAVAAGVVSEGSLMAMYGSSGYFIRVGSSPITHPDLWSAPYVFQDRYVLAAGTAATGTATRWISDVLGITDDEDSVTFGRLLELAEGSPPGARGVLALPHLSGERTPFQDPDSRAAVVGLGLEHTRSDIARAVLEGAGHAVAEAILTYLRAGVPIDRVVAIGGATKNRIITGTVSTVTGLRQQIADSPGAAYGDAFLAALAVGGVPDLSAGAGWWSSTGTVEPDAGHAAQLRSDHEAFVALYRTLAPWNTSRRNRVEEVAG
ncbi:MULTISPECIES: FGGY-family carbohydrate kinase [unclassified Nocardioides]|uniref:FGGY-family carbohydrate kinase n=1 Tax=unclassified Nocardioides TaxID=2615069 RepID=UPI000056FE1D|nr:MULTISPECIES: FGGY-family carbohydrate kinase [unclassified Nocardioides]ABL82815.1 carbohydrate kinase, FGGY [Nocardioides sp. JS614]